MGGILTGRRGLAGAVLVLVIVWALAAVLMLTGTLVAAKRINTSVKTIKPEVSNIKDDTVAIRLAARTNRIATRIRVAAVPLTGHLDDTLKAAKDIDRVAKSILGKAGPINRVVVDINGNVKTIGGTVDAISANANAINASVRSINANARSINASALGIGSSARSINASVNGIRGSGSTILGKVRVIDGRVSGINDRAVTIQGVARSLGGDLHSTLGIVGTTNDPRTILGHANSIDCSTLLNLTGRTQDCQR